MATLSRIWVLIIALASTSAAQAESVTFNWVPVEHGVTSCLVSASTNSSSFVSPCPVGGGVEGNSRFFPISASIAFTESAVASGSATIGDIVSINITTGDFVWNLTDLTAEEFLTNHRVVFSNNGATIDSFMVDTTLGATGTAWRFRAHESGQVLRQLSLQSNGILTVGTFVYDSFEIDPITKEWQFGDTLETGRIAWRGTWCFECEAVTIDVKPGGRPNSINIRSKGQVSVAILTTGTFDATQVDWETVSFGPSSATESHGRSHVDDVDNDGDSDMVLHFNTGETGIACGDTETSLTGETFDGLAFVGTDSIDAKCRQTDD